MPSVDIVIVNWNTGDALRACIRSLKSLDRSSFSIERIVVVDNASSDRSCEDLENGPLPVTLDRNGENRGFAAACNQGAAGSRADYLLFLNPDTAVFGHSLSMPLAFMEAPPNAEVGIAGVHLVNERGEAVTSCARFPTLSTFFGQATGLADVWPRLFPPHLMSADECRQTREVDQIIGAFFLVRRSLFERLRGFDERFFVYFEEVDFSLRARQLGFRSVYISDASACHHGGVSSGQAQAQRLFYLLRSRLLYGFKHYAAPSACLLVGVTALEFGSRIAHAAARGSFRELGSIGSAYLRLVLDVGHRAGAALMRTRRAGY